MIVTVCHFTINIPRGEVLSPPPDQGDEATVAHFAFARGQPLAVISDGRGSYRNLHSSHENHYPTIFFHMRRVSVHFCMLRTRSHDRPI